MIVNTKSNCLYCDKEYIVINPNQKYCSKSHRNKHYYRLNKQICNQHSKNNYNKNKERVLKRTKNYYLNNKEKMDASIKEWHKKNWEKNKESLILKSYAYRLKNPDKIAIYQKRFSIKHRDKINAQCKKRYHTDKNFKLRGVISTRIRQALKGEIKSTKTINLLGCSIDYLRKHLESKFEDWMSWENHGSYDKNLKTWHIDHIIPCASFNLIHVEQQKKCFHYSNLQPLLAIDNILKNDKLIKDTPTLKREK